MDRTEPPQSSGYVDSLRLSAREHADILHELDARARANGDNERRREERLSFSEQALLFVQIRHPGGTAGNYLVRTRNLSRTGIGFFHGSFIYTGTTCTIALRSVDKVIVAVEGTVVRCAHVRGHVHEIGVKFEKPIRLRQFLGSNAPDEGSDAHSTEIPRLAGRVLCVDDSTADQDLFNFHLHNLGLQCNIISKPMDALDLVESAKFDTVFVSTSLSGGGMSAADFVPALRESGYRGPIIAMTADDAEAGKIQSGQSGFAGLLVKPYRFEDLLTLLLRYFTPQSNGTHEVLPSQLWSDLAMRPLIKRFLEGLVGKFREIQKLSNQQDGKPLFRKMCTELKGSAGSYGYPQISQAAHALLDEGSPYDFPGRVETLGRLCHAAANVLQAAGSPPPTGATGKSTVSDAA